MSTRIILLLRSRIRQNLDLILKDEVFISLLVAHTHERSIVTTHPADPRHCFSRQEAAHSNPNAGTYEQPGPFRSR
jgi:hypothetical protein